MITIQDFLRYKSISNVHYAKDGKHFTFVVHQPDLDKNLYKEALFLYDMEHRSYKELSRGESPILYRWLDDTTLLLRGDKIGKETSFFYVDLAGSKRPAFTVPHPVHDIYPVGKDDYVFTTTTDLTEKHIPAELSFLDQPGLCEIIDEVPFWFNAKGFVNKKRTSLFRFRSTTGACAQITEPYAHVESLQVAEGLVLFMADTYTDIRPQGGLYSYDVQSGQVRSLVAENTYRIHHYGMIQSKLYFIACDLATSIMTDNPVFYLLEDGQIRVWLDQDQSITDNVTTDCKHGANETLRVFEDELYFIATDEFSSNLWKADLQGNVTKLSSSRGAVNGFAISEKGIVLNGLQNGGLQELYKLEDAELKPLSCFNAESLKREDVSEPTTVTIQNGGHRVNYVVLKPLHYQAGKKYPSVLYIHGGAKVCYTEVFFHEMQCLASLGYFVFYGNPRGSDGQGSEFAKLQGNYGVADYNDIMAATDAICKLYPDIDTERMAVMGGSYGGIMTNFIVGKTDRFRCAVAQRSICNMTTALLAADNGFGFVKEQMDADPWCDMEKLWEQSPLKNAHKVKTPMLFIHATEDYRCHYVEAMQMFTALKIHGVESRICLIEGENHELSRNGKPMKRILRMNEIFGWVNRHLQP